MEQRFFAAAMVMYGTDRLTCLSRDIANGRTIESPRRKDLLGRIKDALSGGKCPL